MKKFFCVLFMFMALFTLAGCSTKIETLVKENMSDMRINYFEGENNLLFADLSCGYREQTFAYDGVSTQKVECGVLSVEFKKTYSYSAISINLIIDGESKEYVLQKSPFEDKYMVDLEHIVNNNSQISFTLKNQTDECNLICISKDWKIQYGKAIEIAVNDYKGSLEKLYFNNKFNGEGYLKIVSKQDYQDKFWYFSFIDRSGQSKSMLIDVNSGKIIKN